MVQEGERAGEEKRSEKVVAMVIARMGSTRVPGKSLIELEGRPLVAHVLDIARKMKRVDEVVLVTSELPLDDPLAALGEQENVRVVRGHPEFVLDRIVTAIGETGADVVVYVGGDCPLLDPAMIDGAIDTFFRLGCDYLNNYAPPTFPEGLDINILRRETVMLAHDKALAPSQRIHAFSYLTRHPGSCHIENVTHTPDLSAHHWSLDFPEDLAFLRAVYARLYGRRDPITIDDVLELIDSDPEVAALDKALQRPPVGHAFWNSPGMMRDMNADVRVLGDMAQQALEAGNRERARLCYLEMGLIIDELQRFCSAGTQTDGTG